MNGANANALPTGRVEADEATAVNDVVATNIAASVATATNLSVAPSVTSLAISTQIESTLPTSDDSSISKPSIIQVSAASRNIASYTVQPGDTADSLAAKFDVSKDTIKWANNLVSDALTVGQVLQILPRTGITYTVKDGDTIKSIAEKYKGDVSVITTYNDLEISGVTAGLKIVIPNGILPTNERPGYTAPVVSSSSGSYYGFRSGSVGNKYGYGYCTWYVYERRLALGKPVGSYWGDAGSWKFSGERAGFVVNQTPAAGAVLVELGSPGHNGVVESVLSNGDIIISEMNNRAYGGWNVINNRTIPASQVANYWYVH